eukprot:GHVP01058162.1.p1 GENE.GHVP01058162.1~~GHVP01058162.1.p1  ORF type:complete len:202 (+),score=36.52 GHVP01058162.1:391-996(+)
MNSDLSIVVYLLLYVQFRIRASVCGGFCGEQNIFKIMEQFLERNLADEERELRKKAYAQACISTSEEIKDEMKRTRDLIRNFEDKMDKELYLAANQELNILRLAYRARKEWEEVYKRLTTYRRIFDFPPSDAGQNQEIIQQKLNVVFLDDKCLTEMTEDFLLSGQQMDAVHALLVEMLESYPDESLYQMKKDFKICSLPTF